MEIYLVYTWPLKVSSIRVIYTDEGKPHKNVSIKKQTNACKIERLGAANNKDSRTNKLIVDE